MRVLKLKSVFSFILMCWGMPLLAQETKPDATTAATPALSASSTVTETDPKGRIFIQLGDPNLRKVLMAIDNTQGAAPTSMQFNKAMENAMDFTDLFELLPQSKFPADRGGIAPNTFKLEPFKALGVEFLMKSLVQKVEGRIEVEVRLYDVVRAVQIFGRRYPIAGNPPNPGRELAHAAANDLVQVLTGESGIFRTKILMSCGRKIKELFTMDYDGENIVKLTADANFALSPSWSKDGKRIVFTSYRPATKKGPVNPNLYMYDFTTKQRTLVSAAQGLNTGGVFHPNGDKVAYTFSPGGKGRPEIYVQSLSEKTRKSLTNTEFFSVEPDYSPDGTKLAYSSSKTGRPHIYVSSAEGSNAKRLTFAGVYNSSPRWSPKGDKLAFSGQETTANNFNIFLIDPSGSNLQRLTDDKGSSNENPSFSPDNRFIAFSSNRTGSGYRIHTMTIRGTRIRAVSPPGLGDCKQPAWSPRL